MKLFAVLLLLLLLLGMFSLSVAEVVDSFKDTCPQFFIKDKNNQAITPTVFNAYQYKQICQFYKGEYRFATLYDTIHRIPVYSAYTYTITGNRKIKYNDWKIEPQVTDTSPNQADTSPNKADTSPNEKYTRGHLFPKSYAFSDQQKESTFTLTNTAPQIQKSNEEWAEEVEIPMRKVIKENCDEHYLVNIVTGVVPGDTWLPIQQGEKKNNQRVNIPRYFWTAYSCKSKNNDIKSNAYIAKQITGSPTDKLSIDELNKKLEKHYGTPFCVFG
ncbi:endonuclease domain-containing 1 protein-like [Astyanax mexicanus]|uniref:Endonuclease domain-containing 1 protein-like n=1 Tax=Astyanax mexicanus TaxID=7994 RepID=A0A8T2KY07_ASTMX|nr:endonuclease domain-containing 1 protein-like [Astyanax mexicanus]